MRYLFKTVMLFAVCSCAQAAHLLSEVSEIQTTSLNPTVQSAISAHIDAGLLVRKEANLQMRLPGNLTMDIVFDGLKQNPIKGYSWQGHVKGSPEQTVLLSGFDGSIAGSIHTLDEVYEITPLGDKQIQISQLNTAAFPESDDGVVVPHSIFKSQTPMPIGKANRGTVTVDVIVVYTPEARNGAGGTAAIKSIAQAAVDAMNSSFTNSGVDTEVVLLYAGEVNYNDSGDSGDDLTWLQSSTEVRQLLDLYGGDMTSLLVNSLDGFCGRGYVMQNPGPGFRDYAVQVTARGCAVGNLSFAHEFGHNMGLEHDPANGSAPENASYPWSFGHFHDGSYRTVMSYSSECVSNCTRRQYYSNPNVNYLGTATGIADERDNARTLGLTSSVSAAFRTRVADLIFKDGFD